MVQAKQLYQEALYEAAEKAAKVIKTAFEQDYNQIGMNRLKAEAAIKFLAVVEKASLPPEEKD